MNTPAGTMCPLVVCLKSLHQLDCCLGMRRSGRKHPSNSRMYLDGAGRCWFLGILPPFTVRLFVPLFYAGMREEQHVILIHKHIIIVIGKLCILFTLVL